MVGTKVRDRKKDSTMASITAKANGTSEGLSLLSSSSTNEEEEKEEDEGEEEEEEEEEE